MQPLLYCILNNFSPPLFLLASFLRFSEYLNVIISDLNIDSLLSKSCPFSLGIPRSETIELIHSFSLTSATSEIKLKVSLSICLHCKALLSWFYSHFHFFISSFFALSVNPIHQWTLLAFQYTIYWVFAIFLNWDVSFSLLFLTIFFQGRAICKS